MMFGLETRIQDVFALRFFFALKHMLSKCPVQIVVVSNIRKSFVRYMEFKMIDNHSTHCYAYI